MDHPFIYIFYALFVAVTLHKVTGDCGALPTVNNGAPEASPSITVGSLVEYTCDTGYEFATEATNTYSIECLAGDTWAAFDHCEKVNCPVIPDGDHTTLSSNNNQFGASVTISCDDLSAFRIPGVAVGSDLDVTCLANKTWDLWEEVHTNSCIPIECVYPMDPNSDGDTPITAVHTFSRFTCNTGFFYDDGTSFKDVTCNAFGQWGDSTFNRVDWVCDPLECDELASTYNLQNVILDPITHFVGGEVTVSCKPGHEFNDSSIQKIVTCYGNETWSFIPFDCEARLCPPVFNISHANISTLDNWYPTVVNFSCVDGYFFPDGGLWRISECNKYGKWSNAIPQCSDTLADISTNYNGTVTDAEGAESYGIIALSLIGVLLAAIVIFDMVTFGIQINYLKRNLMSRFDCLKPDEDDLESLDGDEVMRASSISLGRGRITPAASTVDLQYGEKSRQSQLNTLEDVELVNEELEKAEIAGKKNIIPRTRLMSAKASIQNALTRTMNVNVFKQKLVSAVQSKNSFASAALPLGAENYGKVIEMRPPSPAKEEEEESEEESEYETDDEEEEEEGEARV